MGVKFLNIIAKHITNMGYDFSIKTSAKNLINSLRKKDEWIMINYGFSKCSSIKNAIDFKRKSLRKECKTASFFYKKIKN